MLGKLFPYPKSHKQSVSHFLRGSTFSRVAGREGDHPISGCLRGRWNRWAPQQGVETIVRRAKPLFPSNLWITVVCFTFRFFSARFANL